MIIVAMRVGYFVISVHGTEEVGSSLTPAADKLFDCNISLCYGVIEDRRDGASSLRDLRW